MKQVLRSRRGLVVVRDVPEPHLAPGEVLVQNAFSAISSGTERASVAASQKSLVARVRERPDLVRTGARRVRTEGIGKTRASIQQKLGEESVIGYSSAGHVLRVGSAVVGLSPGDRVACAGVGFASHAELVAVPANLCARVPPSVPLENASLTTIAAISLHGIRLADVDLGARVAVIGCGLVGQIACRLVRSAGAEVFAIDVDAEAVAEAVAGGADHGLRTGDRVAQRVLESAPFGVDAVLVTAAASTNDPLLLAAEIARDRAAVVLIGDVPIELPRAPFYRKELSFRISRSYGPGRYDVDYEERGIDYPIGFVRWTQQRNMECVLELQARRQLDLEPLIADIVPVENAAEAYARLGGDADQRPRGALLLEYPEVADDVPREGRFPAGAAKENAGGAVRIGLIGPGRFATSVLVPAFVEGGAQLELVGGGSGPSAESAVRNHGFKRVAETESAVIEDPSVDAVVIATRHATHAALAMQALQAGKHVFCEKPLALDEEELGRVLDAARRSEGVLFVGFNRRFSPLLRELKSFLGEAPLVANYRVSAGRIAPSAWVHDLDSGGGRILGELCHFVDSLVYLTGARVQSVAAASMDEPSLPMQARDNVAVSVTLDDGSAATVTYVAAGASSVPKERLEAFAGKRTGILDDYTSLELHGDDGPRTEKAAAQDKGHVEEVAAFLDAVRRGVPLVALEEIENVSLAALAVVESLRSGATVGVRALRDSGDIAGVDRPAERARDRPTEERPRSPHERQDDVGSHRDQDEVGEEHR
jgi:predicted dehydrogenase/threonine dehydrogenase-like Zn-dependent dehydrogenase